MSSLGVTAMLSVVAMGLAWGWQQYKSNAGIVDVVWAFGMMAAGLWYAYSGSAPLFLKLSLSVLAGAWYLRLGAYLAARVFSEAEDSRYLAMRKAMGQYATLGFLGFFLLQAGFIWVLSLPFFAVAINEQPRLLLVVLALLLAAFALWGETTADRQLANFKRNPDNRGKTCRDGWWRYSRHPNYFFEWLHWFAYPLMGWGGVYQYVLWLAPMVMFVFLYFLTGIPFSEQQALRNRGENYRQYRQVTSTFFLWWPRDK